MAQIPTSNVSMAAINTEVSSVNSHDLKTLSTNAVSKGSGTPTQMINIAPYKMDEFRGYVHSTPFTSQLTGNQAASVAGASLTSADAATAASNYFGSANSQPGIDFRFYMYAGYNGYVGNFTQAYLYVKKTSTATNSWYDNSSNVTVHMGTNTIALATAFNPDFAAANEIMFEFDTSYAGPTVTGATANTSSSVSVSGNGGGTTSMANNTWYSISSGAFNGGATLRADFIKHFQADGTAHFENTTWLKIWVRNTSTGKSATVIREQDIRLYGDSTIFTTGGGFNP